MLHPERRSATRRDQLGDVPRSQIAGKDLSEACCRERTDIKNVPIAHSNSFRAEVSGQWNEAGIGRLHPWCRLSDDQHEQSHDEGLSTHGNLLIYASQEHVRSVDSLTPGALEVKAIAR